MFGSSHLGFRCGVGHVCIVARLDARYVHGCCCVAIGRAGAAPLAVDCVGGLAGGLSVTPRSSRNILRTLEKRLWPSAWLDSAMCAMRPPTPTRGKEMIAESATKACEQVGRTDGMIHSSTTHGEDEPSETLQRARSTPARLLARQPMSTLETRRTVRFRTAPLLVVPARVPRPWTVSVRSLWRSTAFALEWQAGG